MIPSALRESFRTTLLSGRYNLLFGSGISLSSKNGLGERLRSADELRTDLCKLKNVKESTSLQRVSNLLSKPEQQTHLVKRFSNCVPAGSLRLLPRYVWHRFFTFNIDDVIERVYEQSVEGGQCLIALNFDSSFEPSVDRDELHLVHLHGSVSKQESGFVFSHSEYARVMASNNPWMGMLAQILSTESFIIAGTTLNEIDLEYYLSYRTEATPRRSRGPSILLEPFPDPATEADCQRYGLILVRATFEEFLNWLSNEYPKPPSLIELSVPGKQNIFPTDLAGSKLLRFFSDFQLIEPGEQPRALTPSPFLYGREPVKADLDQHLDIPRSDTTPVFASAEAAMEALGSEKNATRLLVILGQAGTGKTTVLKRTAYDLAQRGVTVLGVHTLSRIDVRNTIDCLLTTSRKLVLLVDGLADHSEQVQEILNEVRLAGRILVIAAERSYRREQIELLFSEVPHEVIDLKALTKGEFRQLIEIYRGYGLIGNADALKNPDVYADNLRNDPITVAVCRILNDFRPLQSIIESLWEATDVKFRIPFLCASLARHCHVTGIKYTMLQAIAGNRITISALFTTDAPLGLTENTENDEYTVPLNSSVAEAILFWRAEVDEESVFEAFRLISGRIAIYVNRLAIMTRTPEARIAGRLFDADKIVKPILRKNAERLFELCQRDWAWNSRFWEQRALLLADTDIDTALRYARHAVAIENHPHPLTTLGKLLFIKMSSGIAVRASAFDEAFNVLNAAIDKEGARSRITVHPFSNLLYGVIKYLELGGTLTPPQGKLIEGRISDAEYWFPNDHSIERAEVRLRELIG